MICLSGGRRIVGVAPISTASLRVRRQSGAGEAVVLARNLRFLSAR